MKIDPDSDDIFRTEEYLKERQSYTYVLNDADIKNTPKEKLFPDTAKLAKDIALRREGARKTLEQETSNIKERRLGKLVATVMPFEPKDGQRVWIVQPPKEADCRVLHKDSLASLFEGPAEIRQFKKGPMVVLQTTAWGHEREPVISIELTPDFQKYLALPVDIQREAIGRLEPYGKGWKLRMNYNVTVPEIHIPILREMAWLQQKGMIDSWKIFNGGEMSDGKTSTIYVGDGRKAAAVTKYLESLFGRALWNHKNTDDVDFGECITGRFEIAGVREISQYVRMFHSEGSQFLLGEPHSKGLCCPAEIQNKAHGQDWSFDEKLSKIHEYFSKMYGSFYNGGLSQLPNLPPHLRAVFPAPSPSS